MLLSKSVLNLQTPAVCLHMFCYCLIGAKLYLFEQLWLWTQTVAESDKETRRNNTVCEWVWANFPFMLGQEKCYFQVKYVCYYVVRQKCSRSRMLLDRRYFLICFILMRSEFKGFSLQDFRRRDIWLWLYKKYLRSVGFSVRGV